VVEGAFPHAPMLRYVTPPLPRLCPTPRHIAITDITLFLIVTIGAISETIRLDRFR
jgi:hypothetical protein